MKDLAETVNIKESNTVELAEFAQKEKIDLTVVGPEVSLALGIVDEFSKKNLKIFGPSQRAAIIESSKAFAKEFMKKNNIPTAGFNVFDSAIGAINHIKTAPFPLVIKADGLAGGKASLFARTCVKPKKASAPSCWRINSANPGNRWSSKNSSKARKCLLWP